MKVYTFTKYLLDKKGHEYEDKYFEYYDLRNAKKNALVLAKEMNKEIAVTCQHKRGLSFYKAFPDGSWITQEQNIKYNN